MKARLRCGTSGFFLWNSLFRCIRPFCITAHKLKSFRVPHTWQFQFFVPYITYFFCIFNPRPVLISMAVKVQWSLLNAQPNGKRAALTIFQASSVTTTSVPTTMRIVLGVLPTRRSFKYVPKIWYFQGYLKQFGWVIRFIFDTSFFSLFVK